MFILFFLIHHDESLGAGLKSGVTIPEAQGGASEATASPAVRAAVNGHEHRQRPPQRVTYGSARHPQTRPPKPPSASDWHKTRAVKRGFRSAVALVGGRGKAM